MVLSIVGIRLSRNSTTDTLEPSRPNTEPISKPMTPPPIITKCLGTSLSSKASVLVMILFLSSLMKGSMLGLEPEAMITYLLFKSVALPLTGVTVTVFLSLKDPTPVCTSILFFFIKKAMPSTDCFTTSSFRLIIWVRFTFRFFN